MPTDIVADDEALYRAVANLREHFPRDAQGVRRLSAAVFSDRKMRPSVDRAYLRGYQPERSKFSLSDGVLQVYAHQVRAISVLQNDEKGRPMPYRAFVADVEPVPVPENEAHAEIYGKPPFDNKSVFRRVCEVLTRNSEWAVEPTDWAD